MRKGSLILGVVLCVVGCAEAAAAAVPQAPAASSFEMLTRRMDVDVDGAPNAYGPPGSQTLDFLKNAHYRGRPHAPIVGFLTEEDDPKVPVRQGPHDPFPGLYISQTAFTDPERTDERDVRVLGAQDRSVVPPSYIPALYMALYSHRSAVFLIE